MQRLSAALASGRLGIAFGLDASTNLYDRDDDDGLIYDDNRSREQQCTMHQDTAGSPVFMNSDGV